ncbi:hypothetical protein selz4t2_97 [Salmonella phage selz]|nr:hypothetical protein selz4t2_97 [Salmonella phage selz]
MKLLGYFRSLPTGSPNGCQLYSEVKGDVDDIDGIHFSVPPDTCLLEHNRGHKPHRWHKGFVNVPILEWLRKP